MSDMVGSSVEVEIFTKRGLVPGESGKGKVYDPLGMTSLHNVAPDVFPHAKWLRESELKHGRAAMLATVGVFATQIGPSIPGYTAVADPVENLNQFALNFPGGIAQVVNATYSPTLSHSFQTFDNFFIDLVFFLCIPPLKMCI
jgi:hypothetical protein